MVKTNMTRAFSEKQAKIIRDILCHYPYLFLAFGSRVKGTHKEYSDLDLCYQAEISDSVIALLMDDFEQSDLPFKVDLVAWKRCSPEFQRIIRDDLVPIEEFLFH